LHDDSLFYSGTAVLLFLYQDRPRVDFITVASLLLPWPATYFALFIIDEARKRFDALRLQLIVKLAADREVSVV
jgi:hypothetical protein